MNPNNFKADKVLLYYHNGAWEQAEVDGVYTAWDPVKKQNVMVAVVNVTVLDIIKEGGENG